jgi:hypothetical protein
MADLARTTPTKKLAEIQQAVVRGVVVPLLKGGQMLPARPLGPLVSYEIASWMSDSDADMGEEGDACRQIRDRRGRLLVAVDSLGPMSFSEWLMVCALNDILQIANPNLPGLFTNFRLRKLVDSTSELLSLIPEPDTLQECLARHATFGGLFKVHRVDRLVRWWTGSQMFRGTDVPKRLLAWPSLRSVWVQEKNVPVEDLATEFPIVTDCFRSIFKRFLRLSPLTDMVNAGREQPEFIWHATHMRLVNSGLGAAVVRRALAREGTRCSLSLERAFQKLPAGSEQYELVMKFLKDRRTYSSLFET